MTDLTEQLKKGELPSGWYWVDYYSVDGAVMLEYIPQHNGFGYEEKELVQAVLAPVPSYEEYTKLKEELKDYEYQHKQDGMCYDDLFCKLELARKENRTLKKMLKECKPYIALYTENNKHIGFTPETANLLQQIKEALGEDK